MDNKAALKKLHALLNEKKRRQISFEDFAKDKIFITDKQGNKVNFIPNEIQEKINKTRKELIEAGKPPRIIILKARQEGVSTNEQAQMFYKICNNENRSGLVVSHESKSATAIFEKAKYMYNNMPEDDKPLMQKSNTKELILNQPSNSNKEGRVLNSKITIAVAGDTNFGRSEPFHYMHLSEFAFWKGKDDKSPIKQLSGALASIPANDTDTWVVIESTANGYNAFKDIWDKAVAGENGWTPLFFAWHDFHEYEKEFESKDDKKDFIKTLTEYEQFLYYDLNIPINKVYWWRWKFKENNEDLDMMKQEFPSTPEEAFVASGKPFFDSKVVAARYEQLRGEVEETYSLNYKYDHVIYDDTIELIADKHGDIVIYERPKKGIPYVIGADTAGEGSDFNVAYVINNITGEDVAKFEIPNDEVEFSKMLYCMGKIYGELNECNQDALMAIEVNFSTFPNKEVERLGYTNMYVREEAPDSFTGKYKKKTGFNTNKLTRPAALGDLKKQLEENPYKFKSKKFFYQALRFIRNEKKKPEAQSGFHDDDILARAIAEYAREQQSGRRLEEGYYIDFDKLAPDLREDYYNSSGDMRKLLLQRWKERGIIE